MATVVSPQLSSDSILGHILDKNITTATISQQITMEAPKSSLPRQKQMSSELPPVFTRIAYCESQDRQFDENGDVVRGINVYDIGRYQINTLHWAEQAKKMGFDLNTEEGNEAMALYLYKKFGTKPWRSSQRCWERRDQAYLASQ